MGTANIFFDRDISWLSFNGSVLSQADKADVPLLERIKFLAIFSSNLDEFYRVRVPVLRALDKIKKGKNSNTRLMEISRIIDLQQKNFGEILDKQIIPSLNENNISLVYNQNIPTVLIPEITSYFYTTLAAYLEIVYPKENEDFFFENGGLYLLIDIEDAKDSKGRLAILTIPSHAVSRFYTIKHGNTEYILFIDDIIKHFLPVIFSRYTEHHSYAIKVTRDADLDLQDEFNGDIAQKIESQLTKRDFGLATRLLHAPDLPIPVLNKILKYSNLENATIAVGGNYHNLKDFFTFPVNRPSLKYPPQHFIKVAAHKESIFDVIGKQDILVHTPYMAYDPIISFFAEAAIHPQVTEIYTTIYRVASNSKIAHALTNAAKNGKKVTVFVELKARFDEANNIKWAKVMKAAGVNIIYSIPRLKVHAKVTLVKRKIGKRENYHGLLSTGNFNENTAKIYTDHTLMTSRPSLVRELEILFIFLSKRRKPLQDELGIFKTLLVAQFNLKDEFLKLIDREIAQAQRGLPSRIRIKLNNLEEETMIQKLYEASNAGVTVELMIRGICRLKPGVKDMSENIQVKRIVDRYLEHGRIYIFENSGFPKVYLGSADWMSRNIYSRIEVCCPVLDSKLQRELISIFELYWKDNISAVQLSGNLEFTPIESTDPPLQAQLEVFSYLQNTVL